MTQVDIYCGYVYKITYLQNNRCYVGQKRKPIFDTKYWGSSKSISKNNKGKHWYTNGEINRFQKECPIDFRPGRSKKVRDKISQGKLNVSKNITNEENNK